MLAAVLELCQRHPLVAKAWRNNVGAMKIGDRYVRFGEPGTPDVMGFMKDGRFLAIEAKSEDGKLTDKQREFLANARDRRCIAGLARSVDDALAIIEERV